MEVSPHPTILRYGVIAGLISIATFVLGVVTGVMDFSSMMSSVIFGLISMVISVGVLVVGVKYHRDKELGGMITFGQAFAVAFGISLISLIIGSLGQYVYTTFIDPAFYDTMVENMTTMLEKYNVPEDQIAQSVEPIKTMGSFQGMLMSILKGTLGMSILSAIIALILKKQPNPFSNKPFDQL